MHRIDLDLGLSGYDWVAKVFTGPDPKPAPKKPKKGKR